MSPFTFNLVVYLRARVAVLDVELMDTEGTKVSSPEALALARNPNVV